MVARSRPSATRDQPSLATFSRQWNESAIIGCLMVPGGRVADHPAVRSLTQGDFADPFHRETYRAIEYLRPDPPWWDSVTPLVAVALQMPWVQVANRLMALTHEARFGVVYTSMVERYVDAVRDHARRQQLSECLEAAQAACDSAVPLSTDEIWERVREAVQR